MPMVYRGIGRTARLGSRKDRDARKPLRWTDQQKDPVHAEDRKTWGSGVRRWRTRIVATPLREARPRRTTASRPTTKSRLIELAAPSALRDPIGYLKRRFSKKSGG